MIDHKQTKFKWRTSDSTVHFQTSIHRLPPQKQGAKASKAWSTFSWRGETRARPPPLAPSRPHLLPTRRCCGKKLESRRTWAGALRMPSGRIWCRSLEGRFFSAARAGPLRPGSGRPGELSAFCSEILPSGLYRSVPGWRRGSLGLRVPRGPGLGERGRGRAAVSP